MEGAHDLGGLDGFGPVVTDDGEVTHHEPWELRAQALAGFGVGGPLRPWIEGLDPATYLSTPYYGRWLLAGEHAGIAKGTFTADELRRSRERFEANDEATPPRAEDAAKKELVDRVMTTTSPMGQPATTRFAVGDQVVVHRMRDARHHTRCPRYVRGAVGRVEQICGEDSQPDGHEVVPVYTIEFSSTDLWGEGPEPPFSVMVDLFEHYLVAASSSDE